MKILHFKIKKITSSIEIPQSKTIYKLTNFLYYLYPNNLVYNVKIYRQKIKCLIYFKKIYS